MADGWAAIVLVGGAAVAAGQGSWFRHQRRQHHARVAARRLQAQAQADLTRLAKLTQPLEPAPGPGSSTIEEGPIFGPDLIGDFYRVVVAELQAWSDEAAVELEQLHGRRLLARRAALRALRTEIRAICTEIEERQTQASHPDRPLAPILERASLAAGLWPTSADVAER